jgi:hypothetical protein
MTTIKQWESIPREPGEPQSGNASHANHGSRREKLENVSFGVKKQGKHRTRSHAWVQRKISKASGSWKKNAARGQGGGQALPKAVRQWEIKSATGAVNESGAAILKNV